MIFNLKHVLQIFLISLILSVNCHSQQPDSLRNKNLYNPQKWSQNKDTVSNILNEDQKRDSIELRIKFIQDSINRRQIFIRDSIIRRKQVLDSLNFLKNELQSLLEAYFNTTQDEIILRCKKISIIGDSVLSTFDYITLLFGASDPYKPWIGKVFLTGNKINFTIDNNKKRIISINTPEIHADYERVNGGKILIIKEKPVIQKNSNGNFYKEPIDSIFYDQSMRIVKIKKYMQFSSILNNNQKGQPIFLNRLVVKQIMYGTGNEIQKYETIRFCERWKAYESNKVCSILTYTFKKEGNKYYLDRRNNPANNYSDGTYEFIYDDRDNLKSISFSNIAKTESWQRLIELNNEGNVNCYIDKVKDVIKQSSCMIYHDNDANAKNKVENITTIFEKDGISYYQKNNTTGKIRTRDRMTLEWTAWR